MTRSLITGGAGFIGSHVAEHCLKLGHEVYVMDDMSGGDMRNLPRGAALAGESIADAKAVNKLFAAIEPDYVYHLAAYAAEGLSHFIRRYNYLNNVAGSVNLINAAVNHGVKCFVFTSSIAVYGDGYFPPYFPPFAEYMRPAPIDPYGIAKWAVEQDLRCAHEMFGLNYIVFRPHNVYGERQNIGDRYRNVIGIFMNQCLKGAPMTIFGDGTQERAFTHVDDVAPVIARAPECPQLYNDTFDIGSDEPHTVRHVAVEVACAMGVPANISYLPARHEAHAAYASQAKLRGKLDFSENIGLSAGLARMAAWVNEHGARETEPFAEIEIEKNLPQVWRK